jgi:hypothetical protein
MACLRDEKGDCVYLPIIRDTPVVFHPLGCGRSPPYGLNSGAVSHAFCEAALIAYLLPPRLPFEVRAPLVAAHLFPEISQFLTAGEAKEGSQ